MTQNVFPIYHETQYKRVFTYDTNILKIRYSKPAIGRDHILAKLVSY